ncbi:MAG: deoxyribose-phosphate aldolase [Candidatus Korarchaeota archaeon]
MVTREEVAMMIDHTLLKPTATRQEIDTLCEEAKKYGFGAVCVNPCWVAYAKKKLANTKIKVATVIGFPLGATSTETKVAETENALKDGADEFDMVINIGWLKGKEHELVKRDIEAVVKAAKGKVVKVIIETCYLSEDEKRKACEIAMEAGAHFVKTSTGFGTGGATVEDVKLMRSIVGNKLGVKASGGIRDAKTAVEMINAGASRIGTSSGVKIMDELK